MTKRRYTHRSKGQLVMRILLLIALVSAPAHAGQLATADQQATVIAMVKAKLKDPDSAQFKGIKRMDDGNYCGWVNAKNGFGGYTGFGVFFTGSKGAVMVPPEYSSPDMC
jgi:hypothetical protein